MKRLRDMQALCQQVEDDAQNLREFAQRLDDIEARRQRLLDVYEADWMRLSDAAHANETQRAQIEAAVPDGRYSVLGQDTVWNAITDVSDEYKRLLKALAQRI